MCFRDAGGVPGATATPPAGQDFDENRRKFHPVAVGEKCDRNRLIWQDLYEHTLHGCKEKCRDDKSCTAISYHRPSMSSGGNGECAIYTSCPKSTMKPAPGWTSYDKVLQGELLQSQTSMALTAANMVAGATATPPAGQDFDENRQNFDENQRKPVTVLEADPDRPADRHCADPHCALCHNLAFCDICESGFYLIHLGGQNYCTPKYSTSSKAEEVVEFGVPRV